MRRRRPPQRGQANTARATARCISAAQAQERGGRGPPASRGPASRWDYALDENQFRRLLCGTPTIGRLDRTWAAVRLLEYAPYREIVRLMGFRELVRGWPGWRGHIRSESRKRGLDFLAAWLPEHHPELVYHSRAYLHHRFSDDLDFFVNDDDRFVRLTVTEADIVLKIEMVYDVPAHGGELKRDSVLGPLDSAENILANKLTAAIDRKEPRDLADIWGFCAGWMCRVKRPSREFRARPCPPGLVLL